MPIVTSWYRFVEHVAQKFPETDLSALSVRQGDMSALIGAVAKAHELTFAEAAEVITFRLPQFVEAERLSA